MQIARVEPLTTARALRGPFDYRLPEAMGEVGVGSLLEVPFGPRRILGVVVDLAAESEVPAERLAEPIAALEAGATPELVRLALWVAERYCSTPARGLALVLPPGSGTGARGRAAVLRPRTERWSAITDAGRTAVDPGDDGPRLGERQRAALEVLAEAGELSAGSLAERGVDAGVLGRLEARGLITREERAVRRRPTISTVGAVAGGFELSGAQRACAAAVIGSIDGNGPRERLLHGVTGSGKTEVYLAAIEAAVERGRGAILLVPEIGLTPQTLGRVVARLGERVAVLHSSLSPGERLDEWRRLRSGEARVCVGPRSAVFAPVADLGLIVVDEEHDPSYKQEGDPRYDARAVARRRAEASGAAYLAGTATPRPESWAELERLELPERVDGRPLPPVEVLDMRDVPASSGPLHPATREALAGLSAGGKAIVMLNRRGFAPHLSCSSCGVAVTCPDCDVSLVLKKGRGSWVIGCHHCGHAQPPPRECAECGSVSIVRHGAGTERLEEVIAELVAPAPVMRLDADSVGARDSHARVLGEFGRAGSGVLVGTQMVAKGHDFPDVELSVLVDADSTLRYPDFRAEERTFALVSQLAGRSGRGERGGRVLVQTLAPEADPIAAASRHDTPGFLARELERRGAFGYPPFSDLVALELTGPDEGALAALADRLADSIARGLGEGAELLGPAPRFRRRGRFRRRILVKTRDASRDVAAVRDALDEATLAAASRAGITVAVDVDPQ